MQQRRLLGIVLLALLILSVLSFTAFADEQNDLLPRIISSVALAQEKTNSEQDVVFLEEKLDIFLALEEDLRASGDPADSKRIIKDVQSVWEDTSLLLRYVAVDAYYRETSAFLEQSTSIEEVLEQRLRIAQARGKDIETLETSRSAFVEEMSLAKKEFSKIHAPKKGDLENIQRCYESLEEVRLQTKEAQKHMQDFVVAQR